MAFKEAIKDMDNKKGNIFKLKILYSFNTTFFEYQTSIGHLNEQ